MRLMSLQETSLPAMERQSEKQRPSNGQLIFVPHKDTIRLLEVYVKRSLSLNDGTLGNRRGERKEKWVTMPRKQRRHSSDPSLHILGADDEEIGPFSPSNQTETPHEEPEKPTKSPKKNKKPSFWKNIFGFFYRKSTEEEEQDSLPEVSEVTRAESAADIGTTCLPTTSVNLQKRKTMRRKSLKRRFSKLSMTKVNKPGKDITRVQDAISVEPTYSYYEKFSEELEKIVHEVQEKEEAEPLSDEEVINRIIALTKQQGDAIEDKLKDNPTLSNFFQGMSYSSFQQLADAYLEKEATPTHNPPTVLPTAPELVKLAFTLNFTARVAGLSSQNVGHITGLGNRYLQDRFEYQQVCTDHPWSDSDD
uniref:apoptosis facilitator Bcl-2-like protein 14 n=1 Tax=Semicossyphus pulcher TaxID=241346 RepID=UPI0037E9369A